MRSVFPSTSRRNATLRSAKSGSSARTRSDNDLNPGFDNHPEQRPAAVLAPIIKRVPWTNATANMLRWSRVINPAADPGELRTLLQEFCTTHPSWYAKLALGVSEHQRVSLSSIAVPVTFLAGKWDMLTGARDMLSASKRVDGSRYRELASTHFIPVEFPEIVLEELKFLLGRIDR